ncbi:MAG: hemolysin family protein [Treponema sp.]|jgi:putative hemolysin|nr:hemolysin family protein [Treponema sp.]
MEDPPLILPALIFLVLLSGFFSLGRASLFLSRRTRLRLRSAKEPVLEAAEKPEPLMFSLRIWNLIVQILAAFLALGYYGDLVYPSLLFALVVLGFIIFSEFLPRLIAPLGPERLLCALFPLLSPLSLPWRALYHGASGLSLFLKKEETPGDEELRMALEEGEKSGVVESEERSMVEGVLYLGDRPVSAFMSHRSEIECLDINAGREEVREKTLAHKEQGFFPVVRDTQDDIAGIVSAFDILAALTETDPPAAEVSGGDAAEDRGWKGLRAIMKSPRFIPETMSALKAFQAFKGENENYLCVMDEYGGFAGTLKVADLIEEIVGELSVSSPGEDPILPQEDGTWLADGSVSIDDLAEALALDKLPEESRGEYHTLAGFILKLAGEIPKTGESFNWEGYRFKVADLDGNRIDKVLISRLEP